MQAVVDAWARFAGAHADGQISDGLLVRMWATACEVGARNLDDWYVFDRQHLAYCGKQSALVAASRRRSIGSQQERVIQSGDIIVTAVIKVQLEAMERNEWRLSMHGPTFGLGGLF